MKTKLTRVILWIIVLALLQGSAYAANTAEDLYAEGMQYFAEEDYERAVARFRIAGEVKEYAPAQNMLGVCYRDGLGVDKDLEEAETFFSLAAAQGDQAAADNLTALEQAREEEEEEEKWVVLYSAYAYESGYSSERESTFYPSGTTKEVAVHTISSGKETWTTQQFTLREDGKISGTETYDSVTGDLTKRDVRTYNDEGDLLQLLEYDGDGELISKQTYTYTTDGYTLEILNYDDNGEVKSRQVNEYDADRNPKKYTSYDRYGEITYVTELEYDEEGKKIEEHNEGSTYETIEEFLYDDSGVLVQSVAYNYNDYQGYYSQEITEYTYDAYGNLLEEHTTSDGKEVSSRIQRWGLLRNGEIVQCSGYPEGQEGKSFITPAPEQYEVSPAQVTKGKISLTETVLVEEDGLKVTATKYIADEDREQISLMVENKRNAEIRMTVAQAKINGQAADIFGLLRAKANETVRDTIYLDVPMLEAAGIEKIETIAFSFNIQEDGTYKSVSKMVAIPVQDNRERASKLIPIHKTLLDEDLLGIELIGCVPNDYDVDLYYSVRNSSGSDITLKSGDVYLNGKEAYSLSIYETIPANTDTVYCASINYYPSERVDKLESFEFGLEAQYSYFDAFAKAERIRVEFDASGQMSRFSGQMTFDRDSMFYRNES